MLIAALDLGERARDALDWLQDAVSAITPVGWVLLLVAAAALGWVIANVRALTRLGPIEVQTLEHDDGNVAVKGLTASFREALARTGLIPPPAVPSGTPQVNLLAAVEASNISQAAWVAKLIAMIPRPRPHEYTISGTLQGNEPATDAEEPGDGSIADAIGAALRAIAGGPPADDPAPAADEAPEDAAAPNCGVSVWVRPSREGRELIETYDEAPTHLAALENAASAIYLHVSNHAVEAFPLWARWRDRDALAAYRRGCHERIHDRLDAAIAQFTFAAEQEQFNKLADLELATLYEQQAQLQGPAGGDESEAGNLAIALTQAAALRRYLEILEDANTIVQAHYRVSIVAGMLATRCRALDQIGNVELVRTTLSIKGVDEWHQLAPTLQLLAERENRTVLQMLGPFFTILNDGRVRTQFEPQAHERRQLKHTAGISKHCVWARKMVEVTKLGFWARMELRRRSISVHWLHLKLGWGSLSWQAYYNAASFDALVLERRRKIKAQQQQPPPDA